MNVQLTLNGRPLALEVPEHWTLLRALRDGAGAYEVKHGCGEGVCGACAVLLDGVAVNACSTLVAQADGREVVTAAGIGEPEDPHPLQRALADCGAVQCGFCTPGMIIGALEALSLGLAGDRIQIRHALSGNICRCTGYQKIVEAVERCAREGW